MNSNYYIAYTLRCYGLALREVYGDTKPYHKSITLNKNKFCKTQYKQQQQQQHSTSKIINLYSIGEYTKKWGINKKHIFISYNIIHDVLLYFNKKNDQQLSEYILSVLFIYPPFIDLLRHITNIVNDFVIFTHVSNDPNHPLVKASRDLINLIMANARKCDRDLSLSNPAVTDDLIFYIRKMIPMTKSMKKSYVNKMNYKTRRANTILSESMSQNLSDTIATIDAPKKSTVKMARQMSKTKLYSKFNIHKDVYNIINKCLNSSYITSFVESYKYILHDSENLVTKRYINPSMTLWNRIATMTLIGNKIGGLSFKNKILIAELLLTCIHSDEFIVTSYNLFHTNEMKKYLNKHINFYDDEKDKELVEIFLRVKYLRQLKVPLLHNDFILLLGKIRNSLTSHEKRTPVEIISRQCICHLKCLGSLWNKLPNENNNKHLKHAFYNFKKETWYDSMLTMWCESNDYEYGEYQIKTMYIWYQYWC